MGVGLEHVFSLLKKQENAEHAPKCCGYFVPGAQVLEFPDFE
jgi:hypothetical protein